MYTEGNLTLIAGENLEPGRRVLIKADTMTTPPEIVYADEDEQHIGITLNRVVAGESVAVRPRNATGSAEACAAAAFAAGAKLYGAADGKVTGTGGQGLITVGVALESATADGDIITIIDCTA